jgi:serine/threonine protein kinase
MVSGTPDEETYPGITDLPDWRQFTIYPIALSIQHLVPSLDEAGVDLLQSMLTYDPQKRITAQDARHHRFFNDLPESLRMVGDDMH